MGKETNSPQKKTELDPILVSVLANRLDGIVREMSNTLLRAARSTVIATARDFSCAIVTGNNELLAVAEGLPVHTFGAHLQCEAMTRLHPDISDGDAYIHNDPYLGNTHAADQTILIPVFVEGEHLFTACAKAHQADIGNSIPTTYHAAAKDVYEEGAIIFPCMKLQSKRQMVQDVVRLGMTRIRVPEQWYGDLLAALGAARVAEKRLKELCKKYSAATIKAFIDDWFNYSERMAIQAIKMLPGTVVEAEGRHDPMPPFLNEPVPIRVKVGIDSKEGLITVDLRDNVDCLPCGLNQSEACAINNALTGVFNCIDPDIPHNAGSFRRLNVLLRVGSAVGKLKHPYSSSMATTNIADRIVSTTQSAFAKLGYGYGLSEGSNAFGAQLGVVSGNDFRHGGAPYVNQIFLNAGSGPASPVADGWVTFGAPIVGGLLYRDSIELDEIKQPLLVDHMRLVTDSGGAGYRRGAPGVDVAYGPRQGAMTVIFATDNTETPPKGVHGGADGALASNYLIARDGTQKTLPSFCNLELKDGEKVRSIESTAGGYGDPKKREPDRVFLDVLNRTVSIDGAKRIYGVALIGSIEKETLCLDLDETNRLRSIQ